MGGKDSIPRSGLSMALPAKDAMLTRESLMSLSITFLFLLHTKQGLTDLPSQISIACPCQARLLVAATLPPTTLPLRWSAGAMVLDESVKGKGDEVSCASFLAIRCNYSSRNGVEIAWLIVRLLSCEFSLRLNGSMPP